MVFPCDTVWAVRVDLDLRFPSSKLEELIFFLKAASFMQWLMPRRWAFRKEANYNLHNLAKLLLQMTGKSEQLQAEGICTYFSPNLYFFGTSLYYYVINFKLGFLLTKVFIFFPCTPSVPVLWPLLYLEKEQKGTTWQRESAKLIYIIVQGFRAGGQCFNSGPAFLVCKPPTGEGDWVLLSVHEPA